jgi:hypothetical protein
MNWIFTSPDALANKGFDCLNHFLGRDVRLGNHFSLIPQPELLFSKILSRLQQVVVLRVTEDERVRL